MIISLSAGNDTEQFNLHEGTYDREGMIITPDPKKILPKPEGL